VDAAGGAGRSGGAAPYSRGEASTLGGGDGLAARREGELRAAAARLGLAGVVLAGYRDGTLAAVPPADLAATVAAQLGDADAVVVMEPSGVTGHPDHVAAAAVAAVAADAGLPVIEWGVAAPVAAVLAAELGVRLHPFGRPGAWPAELAVDRDRHRQAIACDVSQQPGNPLLRRRLELQGGRELVRLRPAADRRAAGPVGGGYHFAGWEIHRAADATGCCIVSVHLLAAPGSHPRQHCREP
jgi:LmbE family N-acetylglucosaminyl deacetylase